VKISIYFVLLVILSRF